jgi:hypothetical protein
LGALFVRIGSPLHDRNPEKADMRVDAGTAISGPPAAVESGYNVLGNATEETSCL